MIWLLSPFRSGNFQHNLIQIPTPGISWAIFTQRLSADNLPSKGSSKSDGGLEVSSAFLYTSAGGDARVLSHYTCFSCTLTTCLVGKSLHCLLFSLIQQALFNQAIQRMRSALQLQDINRRNAEIDAARGMLFEALADYRNPHLLEETCAAGQLRRLECSWAIEQSIIGTYQVQNEYGAAGDRISQLQQQIRQDGLTVIDGCDSEDELDFLFPEIACIHDRDLVLLDTWQNQIEWMKALPPSELKQLQSAGFSKSDSAVIGEKNSAATALAIPDEQLFYENLKPKSHFYALRTQLEWMLDRQQRQNYENYIIEQGEVAGHKSLVSSNLEQASDLAVANLFYYFRVRDESEEESELANTPPMG